MDKPKLKKTKNGKWICIGGGRRAIQATAQIAYAKWVAGEIRLLHAENLKLQESVLDMKGEVEAITRKKMEEVRILSEENTKWIVQRINHYNQKCIDWIWQTKTLPSLSQYQEWTGRGN